MPSSASFPSKADYFLDADFIEQVALLAVADEDGRPSIVGGARYIVVRPGQAEASFAVIDDYQAKGVGTVLMRHLAAIGREAGLREFFAEVLSENAPMLKVFERSGLTMSTRRDGMVVHVTLRFARTPGERRASGASDKDGARHPSSFAGPSDGT